MASDFIFRLGQRLGSSLAGRFTQRTEEAPPAEAAPAPEEAPPAESAAPEAPGAEAPPVEASQPVEAQPPVEVAPAADAPSEPAATATGTSSAESQATADEVPAAETAPVAPEKSLEELEEERLWAETDQAWAAGDFTRVTVLLDQLKLLQPEHATEIDQKIAAAQYNAAAELEQAGHLERALFLYQDAQRRDPNLGEASFAIERVQAALQPPAPAAEEAASASAPEQTYTVAEGDTLSAIAERHYGDANAWPRIFEANRDQLDNPDLIYPGQVLRLP